MKSKAKMYAALFAALVVLALVIVLVITLTKNENTTPETTTPAQTNTHDAETVPTTEKTEATGEVPQSEPDTSDEPTAGPDDPPGDYSPLDYFDTTGFFANIGTVTGRISNTEAEFDFTVGVSSEYDKMLFINPTTNYTRNNVSIGYFMYCEQGILWTRDQYFHERSEVLTAHKSDYLIDRTYDQILPAKYVDANNYGLAYVCDSKINPHDEIHVLIVDMNNRRLLGTAKINIDLVNDRFVLTGIENTAETDPDVTELLTALMRQEILTSKFLVIPEKYVLESSILIEKLDGHTYYHSFKKPGAAFMINEYDIEYPVYAVTLNNDGLGFITYYFRPKQYVGEKPISFEVLGYDLINVVTQDDLHNR